MKIHRLHLATLTTPEWHPTPHAIVEQYAYVVTTAYGTLLFDTGIGPAHDFIDEQYRPTRTDPVDAIAGIGLKPADVDVIVNCHLHFDHCGGNLAFPAATVYGQRSEVDDALTPHYTVLEHIDLEAVSVIDGAHTIWPDVEVLSTPGHTRGHQSLRVGTTVLAGQVAETSEDFDDGVVGGPDELADAGRASIQTIKDLNPDRVLFAHDHAEWRPR